MAAASSTLGRVAVFGGSSGIGFATAVRVVKAKAQEVFIIGRNQGKLDQAEAELRKIAEEASSETAIKTASVDMTKEESMIEFYEREFNDKELDSVIITAGNSAFLGNLIENNRTVEEFKKQLDLKFFNQMSAVLHGHKKVQDGGSFVLFSGTLGQRPGHGNTALSVANAAVEASVKGLANDLGFSRRIRINCVCPGMTPDTAAYENMDPVKVEEYKK
eukprot:gene21131-140_t